MPTLDEQIAQALRDSQRSGELASAPSYGRPLDLDDAYAQTPSELRMAFKMLKEAGFVPPEVEAMNELAALRRQAHDCSDPAEAERLRRRISELQQHVALRLEKLRASGSL